MASRVGANAYSGMNKKIQESGLNKNFETERDLKRAQIGSGIYKGKNPIFRARSGIKRHTNKYGWYNKATGNYGRTEGLKGTRQHRPIMPLIKAVRQRCCLVSHMMTTVKRKG